MENLLVINDMGDLMLLEIVNEKMKLNSEIISVVISEIKQNSLQMEIYEEKKNILIELIQSEKLDEGNLFCLKDKFVSI